MKKTKKYKMPDFDISEARSATEFTGLIPTAPKNDYEYNSYNDIMEFSPKSINIYNTKKKNKI